jgi:hypothetical protein
MYSLLFMTEVATVITDQARLLKMVANSSPLLNKEGAGDRSGTRRSIDRYGV